MAFAGQFSSAAARPGSMPPRSGHGRYRLRGEDTAKHGVKQASTRIRRRVTDWQLIADGLAEWAARDEC